MAEIRTGEYSVRLRQEQTKLAEILDDFIAYGKIHKRSWSRDEDSAANLKLFFGDAHLPAITPTEIERYIGFRKQSENGRGSLISAATINRELSCLKTAFNRAIREGKATTNPVGQVKFLAEHNARDRVLSEAEFDRLLAKSPAHLRPILICAYETGMRYGEIISLTWEQVDQEKGIIHLLTGTTKNGEGRKVPISAALREALSRLERNCPEVFTYKGRGIIWAKHSFNRACELAGIKDFRFHDFRHTFVTRMRKAGVPDRVIMSITGHKTFSMLQRYDSIDEDDLRKAVVG